MVGIQRSAHNNGISLNELMRQNPQIKNINQIIHPGDKINVRGKNDQNPSVPSTPKYEDIILDDKKMTPTINTAPSSEQITPPDKIAPISYNYKKKSFVKVNDLDILNNLKLGKISIYKDELIPNIKLNMNL